VILLLFFPTTDIISTATSFSSCAAITKPQSQPPIPQPQKPVEPNIVILVSLTRALHSEGLL
jgi:hypothetical protein